MRPPKLSRAVFVAQRGLEVQRLWTALGFLACITQACGIAGALPLSDSVHEADDYYLGRQNPENVAKGLDLLRAEVAQGPGDYGAWWRISKFVSYEARQAAGSKKNKLLEDGVEAGKKAVALEPNRAEGHYWLGVNYGLIDESRGYWRGLWFVSTIRKEMETVNRLDPDYEQAGGLRTLARLDYLAPFFLGGDKRLSIKLLKECLARYPKNSSAMLFLSDSYMALGLRDEARQELEEILNLCPDPQYGPEQAEDQDGARVRLAKYFHTSK